MTHPAPYSCLSTITRAIAELSRTISEREAWIQHNGSSADYEYRIQAMKEALEIVKGVRDDRH